MVLKSESLNTLEPSEPVQACNGLAFTVVIIILSKYYVYRTVHHCNSWRIRDQLDVTIY